ncbi:hypothetical protein BaRGS_00009461 [Batillaria attramentaria]|uniref:Uncharacterized protein n=1 Tax=Batillaria attramentaria TaxID=370345 RepID=A0ABD0LJ30_9CAEN
MTDPYSLPYHWERNVYDNRPEYSMEPQTSASGYLTPRQATRLDLHPSRHRPTHDNRGNGLRYNHAHPPSNRYPHELRPVQDYRRDVRMHPYLHPVPGDGDYNREQLALPSPHFRRETESYEHDYVEILPDEGTVEFRHRTVKTCILSVYFGCKATEEYYKNHPCPPPRPFQRNLDSPEQRRMPSHASTLPVQMPSGSATENGPTRVSRNTSADETGGAEGDMTHGSSNRRVLYVLIGVAVVTAVVITGVVVGILRGAPEEPPSESVPEDYISYISAHLHDSFTFEFTFQSSRFLDAQVFHDNRLIATISEVSQEYTATNVSVHGSLQQADFQVDVTFPKVSCRGRRSVQLCCQQQ